MIRSTALLIVLFAADANAVEVTRSRSLTTDETIAGIIVQVAWGAVEDAMPKLLQSADTDGREAGGALLDVPTLRIDSRPRTGFWAWLAALHRVAGYALRSDVCQTCPPEGELDSVAYGYWLTVRGYRVRRDTEIRDGRVVLTTSTAWTEIVRIPLPKFLQWLLGKKEIIREVPIHVALTITADETVGRTRLVGVAVATADTSDFHCRGVRFRIAEPKAEAALRSGLDSALLAVQQQGTDWFHAGQFDPAIGEAIARIRAGLKIQLLRGNR